MNDIKTWQERVPGLATGDVHAMQIHDAKDSEIAELRAALEAARATPAQPVGDLHNAIMNLSDSICSDMDIGEKRAYRKGHRDARHAAAELVSAHEASRPSPSSVGDAIRALPLPKPAYKLSKDGIPMFYDVDDMRAILSEAAALAEQVQGQQAHVEPNNEHIICPKCAQQFRAIPVQVQQLLLKAGLKPPFTDSDH